MLAGVDGIPILPISREDASNSSIFISNVDEGIESYLSVSLLLSGVLAEWLRRRQASLLIV